MRSRQQGFTLVELSIVLVIIGFLIAGIATATNMVHQAMLSSVIADLTNYRTAVSNFQAKYNALPGDFKNADNVWNGSYGCNSASVPSCSGNGDNKIEFNAAGLTYSESDLAWIHLGAGKFIPNTFSLSNANTSTQVDTVGLTTPISKVQGAGYIISSTGPAGSSGPVILGSVGIYLGKSSSLVTSSTLPGLGASAISPSDALYIDSKMDDGNPGTLTGATTGAFRTGGGGDAQSYGGYVRNAPEAGGGYDGFFWQCGSCSDGGSYTDVGAMGPCWTSGLTSGTLPPCLDASNLYNVSNTSGSCVVGLTAG